MEKGKTEIACRAVLLSERREISGGPRQYKRTNQGGYKRRCHIKFVPTLVVRWGMRHQLASEHIVRERKRTTVKATLRDGTNQTRWREPGDIKPGERMRSFDQQLDGLANQKRGSGAIHRGILGTGLLAEPMTEYVQGACRGALSTRLSCRTCGRYKHINASPMSINDWRHTTACRCQQGRSGLSSGGEGRPWNSSRSVCFAHGKGGR